MPNIGPTELIIVLVIVLVIFGPKRLPGLGRSLGSGMREFKESLTGRSRHEDEDLEESRALDEGSRTAAERADGATKPDRAPVGEDQPAGERRA